MKLFEFHQRRDLIKRIDVYLQLGDFTPETQRAIGAMHGKGWDWLCSHPAVTGEAEQDPDNIKISERTIHAAIKDISRRMGR